jgi:hypothetical protein
VQGELASWRARVAQIEALVAEAEKPAALALLETAIGELERLIWDLREAAQDADPRQLRCLFVRLVRRIVVRVKATQTGPRRHRYQLMGGEIHLNPGSALSGIVAQVLVSLSCTEFSPTVQ